MTYVIMKFYCKMCFDLIFKLVRLQKYLCFYVFYKSSAISLLSTFFACQTLIKHLWFDLDKFWFNLWPGSVQVFDSVLEITDCSDCWLWFRFVWSYSRFLTLVLRGIRRMRWRDMSPHDGTERQKSCWTGCTINRLVLKFISLIVA